MSKKTPVKPLLSSDALFTIQGALDARIKYLDDLHDRGRSFGAIGQFYINIATERSNTLKARNEVGAAFEAQFPKS